MSAAALSKAGQAEILRASQKDQFFVSHLVQVRIFVLMNKRFNLSKNQYEKAIENKY